MFTINDLNRNRTGNKLGEGRTYSKQRDEVAYELSIMKSVERGETLEEMICEKLRDDLGYDAHTTVHTHDWDITVNIPELNRPVRVECKSALYLSTKQQTSYMFQAVKKENFDFIFFSFVTPDGVKVYWATMDDIEHLISNSKTITITLSKIDGYLEDEIIHEFNEFPSYGA